jgi:hypothetical protein
MDKKRTVHRNQALLAFDNKGADITRFAKVSANVVISSLSGDVLWRAMSNSYQKGASVTAGLHSWL